MSGGGGGSYGYNGGRQQRKRPRDFDDDQYRRPRTFDILEKLKRDLVNLSDPGTVNPIDDMKYVARRFAIDFETPENQPRMLALLRDCILQLSVKTTHYAAMTCLAAAQNPDFGAQAAGMVASTLNNAFERQEWRDVKLLLRFVSGMTYCLGNSGATSLSILEQMVNHLRELLLTERSEYADNVCYVIMITLPYLSAGLPDDSPRRADIAKVVEGLASYMSVRSVPESAVTSPYPGAVESIELLYRQCQNAVASGWDDSILLRLLNNLESELKAEAITMPEILMPVYSGAEGPHQPCEFYFQVFVGQPVESVPATDKVAASVFRDLTSDVLDLLVANRKDCARFLIDLESYLPPDLFVLRGTPLDKIVPGGPTWKAEDIVVEGIFARLFALPRPPHKAVYYHSVLTELCKLVPQAIAPTFGRAIRAIYQKSETLEPELCYRFWDWFSHHLSNFGFNWKWQEWITDLDLPASHPKVVFIKEAITKEAELSYNQRIKTTLPEEYHGLIADEAPGPDFVYATPDNPFSEETEGLIMLLTTQAEAAQVNDHLRVIHQKASETELDPERISVAILVQSVLHLGHQSFSHALNTIEHNLSLLQSKCDASGSTRRSTVAAVMQFWSGRPLIASTLLQKFLNYRIISPLSVLENLLDSSNNINCQSVLWELLKTTIDKVNARVNQVQDRLTTLTQESSKNENAENGEMQEQLRNLQMTWRDVQQDQQEVLEFAVKQLSQNLSSATGSDDEWRTFWIRGLLREVLRRYRSNILGLGKEILKDHPEVKTLLR